MEPDISNLYLEIKFHDQAVLVSVPLLTFSEISLSDHLTWTFWPCRYKGKYKLAN